MTFFKRKKDTRASASRRGYNSEWQALRRAVPRTPCALTGAPWRPYFHLDHIVPLAEGGTNDPSNLQWLSPSAHAQKTAQQDGGFGKDKNKSQLLVRCGCDSDGVPLAPGHHWRKDN